MPRSGRLKGALGFGFALKTIRWFHRMSYLFMAIGVTLRISLDIRNSDDTTY